MLVLVCHVVSITFAQLTTLQGVLRDTLRKKGVPPYLSRFRSLLAGRLRRWICVPSMAIHLAPIPILRMPLRNMLYTACGLQCIRCPLL